MMYIREGEQIVIRFELKEVKNIVLAYKSMTSDVSDFLYFLGYYCQNYGIEFIKIKNGVYVDEKIENLNEGFRTYDK